MSKPLHFEMGCLLFEQQEGKYLINSYHFISSLIWKVRHIFADWPVSHNSWKSTRAESRPFYSMLSLNQCEIYVMILLTKKLFRCFADIYLSNKYDRNMQTVAISYFLSFLFPVQSGLSRSELRKLCNRQKCLNSGNICSEKK